MSSARSCAVTAFSTLPSPFTLSHWHNLFADPIFLEALKNSLIIASAHRHRRDIALFGTSAYLLVSRRTSHGAAVGKSLLDSPCAAGDSFGSRRALAVSRDAAAVLFFTARVWGIALALILADSPVTTQAFKAGLSTIGRRLGRSGAGERRVVAYTYRRILLPLLAPIAAAVGLMNFGSALTSISTPVLLYSHQSRPLAILLLEYSFTGELERAAALGLLMTRDHRRR